MTFSLTITMVLYSIGMACGQLLFKLAAISPGKPGAPPSIFNTLNFYLLGGIVLYGSLTLLWVWILRSVPLSKAYPFVALSFLFTPMLSKLFLDERLSTGYFAGLLLIAAGVIVTVRA
ncbi:MAG: EamA family transporter [Methylomonas sp.]